MHGKQQRGGFRPRATACALALTAAPAVAATGLVTATPAVAAGAAVTVNPRSADPDYATTVTVSGSGFQSVKGGFGGIYVLFGVVDANWRPSAGGSSGADYAYVPDSQDKDNHGFERFVSFPGGSTEAEANGGLIAADGTWHTTLVIPGAKFTAAGTSGSGRAVDCTVQQCGVITIGAHGVANANNETFTPVTFAVPKSSGSTGGTSNSGKTNGSSGKSTAAAGEASATPSKSAGKKPKASATPSVSAAAAPPATAPPTATATATEPATATVSLRTSSVSAVRVGALAAGVVALVAAAAWLLRRRTRTAR